MDGKTEMKTADNSNENTVSVKVTIHIPDNIPESLRQQKINRIYDILTKEKTE